MTLAAAAVGSARVHQSPNGRLHVVRMVSSFGSYEYSENEDTFFIDLYAGGTVKTEKGITLTCETDFPHGGTAKYTIKGEAETTVAIRIPAWS